MNRADKPLIESFAMRRELSVFLAICGCALGLFQIFLIAAEGKEKVTFVTECACQGNHGVSRWLAKTDLAEPPTNDADIKKITSSQILAMQGPGGKITTRSERIAAENQWYAVTGRIDKIKTEDDGDLHIVLRDVNDDAGMIVEIPLGPRWCELRKLVFSWTSAQFPLTGGFKTVEHPIVTITGKIFYDIDHSGNDTVTNRRNYDQTLAVWEIHPVMKIAVSTTNPPAARKASVKPEVAPPPAAPTPQAPAPPTAAPNSQLNAATGQFVTLTKPVPVQIPYGSTILQPGTRLQILSRDQQTIDVRYQDSRYTIPISSTDLR